MRPLKLLVVPTHRAFCVDIPPAVMIEPVVVDVASVVRVEDTPPAAVSRPLSAVVPVTARALVPSVAPPSAKLVAVMPAIVVAPAIVAVVPTHRAFCIEMPPAVMIEPVVADVASVTSVDDTPCANRMRAVVVVCPSFVIAVDKPVARSAVSALNAVDDMTVPVTTGWPLLLTTKVPEPL